MQWNKGKTSYAELMDLPANMLYSLYYHVHLEALDAEAASKKLAEQEIQDGIEEVANV